ncbi:DUF2252 domain-containing protein [Halobacillus aidingensis]|uniref:Uncharacterized conserved protein, DUF2252 family n=1 Tax=Halobacillus aidingensis TaxID=240303 RepID=A0A1H0NCD5_HALAD|nr:DUF2252 family protein [Halobacillus aidingensis]SDO90303.1 Uncharacterized conserved protein, DUF2252 family [Halobacillus aidingensis]
MDQKVKQMLETKQMLRKNSLSTVLDKFDGDIMALTEKERKKKYNKMKADPYSFFRGSAYLFFHDTTDLPFTFHTPRDRPTWIMGDLHFNNFSVFQNENKQIVFDVDDFDEGYLGSYLYDVLRMVVSIRLMMHSLSYDDEAKEQMVHRYLKTYLKQMQAYHDRELSPEKVQFTKESAKGPVKKAINKAEQRSLSHELKKQTIINHDSIRSFDIGKDKLSSVPKHEKRLLEKAWEDYYHSLDAKKKKSKDYYRIKDVVKKTGAGIGSTGLKRYYILIEGECHEDHEDDIILEAKEARTPVPAYFFPYDEAFWNDHKHQGRRVIHTQQAMHHLSDPFLGYFTMDGKDFYVRERSPFSKDVKEKHLSDLKSVKQTVKTMAKVSAKIHARADVDIDEGMLDYHSEDSIMEAVGTEKKRFRQQLSLWAEHYEKKVYEDYDLFLEWGSERGYF